MEKINEKTKENKIWLGKDGIVRIKVGKVIDEKVIKRIINDYKEITRKFSTKQKILIDIKSSTPIPSSLFRKKVVESLKDAYREPGFEKMAIWGGSTVLRVITLFIVKATGFKNIKHFETEKEALQWLKEDQSRF